ncbi:hypothetical protein [Aurantiacibacter sp. MUD61]|uniref:hypothetical protein n=1 Tax=Aurantiacibacter sp. MUD61 TaxID=3009083 RepID=UPI0022F07769|nr:hypothetical protein [Aurantiacibacter sp. MUD61]
MKTLSRIGVMLAATLGTFAALPANAQDAADPCAEANACREISEFLIEGPDGQTHRIPADMTLPWVVDGNILITPGEALVVELVSMDGALVPELRRTGDEARLEELGPGEVLFEFGAFDRGAISLTVRSAYPETLEYAALIVDFGQGPSRTSVCRLMPGVTVREIWQQPVVQLALWSFRPADDYACDIIDPDADFSEREAQ